MKPDDIAPSGRVVAFIDIGTNSVRILVVRIEAHFSYTVLSRQKEVVRLGEGEFIGRSSLKPEAIERAVIVCRRFAELARSFGAEEIYAIATSATREARNRASFLSRMREETGLDVNVVSGKEEARLVYLGVSSGIHIGQNKAAFIDIGGGSTEIIVGTQQEFLYIDSRKIGALRLTMLFPTPSSEGSVSRKLYGEMKKYIHEETADAIKKIQSHHIDCVVGSSGTIENLAEISRQVLENGSSLNNTAILARKDLKKIVEILRPLSIAERKKVPGMNPERADIIIAGAAIVEVLMDSLHLQEIHVSERGLREGLLTDYLNRLEGYVAIRELPVRMMSVLRLGRLFRIDEQHARTTARIALELFNSTRSAGLHRMGDDEREMLEYAAMLHDVGTAISLNNHEIHSSYIIRNAELLGFNERSIAIMANTARFHRKYLSIKQGRGIRDLEHDDLVKVRILANLLCLANSLDRGHSGVVTHAHIQSRGNNHSVIEITASGDCQLEQWALESHKKDFEKAFGKVLTMEIVHIANPDGTGESK